jgi:hypothetical protein
MTWRSLADASRCGIGADSAAYCFETGTPARIGGATTWSSVATATYSNSPRNCALDASGNAYCSKGSTGFPTAAPTAAPIVGLVNYSKRVTGFPLQAIICGLTGSRDLYCFDTSPAALANPDGRKVKQVSAHCAIAEDDKTYCWTNFFPYTATAMFKVVPGQ